MASHSNCIQTRTSIECDTERKLLLDFTATPPWNLPGLKCGSNTKLLSVKLKVKTTRSFVLICFFVQSPGTSIMTTTSTKLQMSTTLSVPESVDADSSPIPSVPSPKPPDAHYIWRIPELSPSECTIIVSGYIRLSLNAITDSSSINIPIDLIHLCSRYYTKDLYALKDIVDAPNESRFTGPIIDIYGFTFYIEVYPNGTRPTYTDQIASFFCLTHLPPNVESIEMRLQFTLKEIEDKALYVVNGKSHRFDSDSYWKGFYGMTKDIKSLNCISFRVQVDGMKIVFKDGTKQEMPAIDGVTNRITECVPSICLWDVTDTEKIEDVQYAQNVYGFVSRIFVVNGIKWFMTFYPNGSKVKRKGYPNVYLHIAAVPSFDFTVNIRHSQGLQGDTHMRDAKFITTFDHDRSSWGLIEQSTYSSKDMVNLKRFLCVAELVMLDMYRGDEKVEITKFQLETKTGDGDRECMYYEPKCREEYEWKTVISKKEKDKEQNANNLMESKKFNAFGVDWKMMMKFETISENEIEGEEEVQRQHVIVGLQLLEKKLDKRCISIRCSFHVPELNVRYFNTMVFDEAHCDGDWGNDRVNWNQIQDVQSCTIKLYMEIVDVFDDRECLTHIVEDTGHLLASE